MSILRIPIEMLGQSGCRLDFESMIIYIDPYLSHNVEEFHDQSDGRQDPVTSAPHNILDADYILITHAYFDRYDPQILSDLANASSQAIYIGPYPVITKLKALGIDENRLTIAQKSWLKLTEGLELKAIPTAHPVIEHDADAQLASVGFLLRYEGKLIYLAGQTSVHQDIFDALVNEGPVHTAFLPVNEHNFFKERSGIIGNMSVRDAFQMAVEIGAKQVVPLHWNPHKMNAVSREEIRLIYKLMKPGFALLLDPHILNLSEANVSVILRTLNEARYLPDLLHSIANQKTAQLEIEVILVDSGSTDGTLEIAEKFGCKIHHISRERFSFGRSLNLGCEAANGDYLVITSGHCVPCDEYWIQTLCQPLIDEEVQYTYGRQFAGTQSFYSECRIFAKYFPATSQIPQEGDFCNNANSALTRDIWEKYKFDEALTGLEDMELAQRLVSDGGQVGYIAKAGVYHHHNETWSQIKRRFEREAIALQKIKPHIHVKRTDMFRYIVTSIFIDCFHALKKQCFVKNFVSIMKYRYCQYLGSYKGNHDHRKLS